MTTYVYKSTTGFPVNIDNYTITPNPGLYSKYQIEALDSAMGSTLSRYDDGVLATNDSNYPATFSLDINNNVTGLVGPGGGNIPFSNNSKPPLTSIGFKRTARSLWKGWRAETGYGSIYKSNVGIVYYIDPAVTGPGAGTLADPYKVLPGTVVNSSTYLFLEGSVTNVSSAITGTQLGTGCVFGTYEQGTGRRVFTELHRLATIRFSGASGVSTQGITISTGNSGTTISGLRITCPDVAFGDRRGVYAPVGTQTDVTIEYCYFDNIDSTPVGGGLPGGAAIFSFASGTTIRFNTIRNVIADAVWIGNNAANGGRNASIYGNDIIVPSVSANGPDAVQMGLDAGQTLGTGKHVIYANWLEILSNVKQCLILSGSGFLNTDSADVYRNVMWGSDLSTPKQGASNSKTCEWQGKNLTFTSNILRGGQFGLNLSSDANVVGNVFLCDHGVLADTSLTSTDQYLGIVPFSGATNATKICNNTLIRLTVGSGGTAIHHTSGTSAAVMANNTVLGPFMIGIRRDTTLAIETNNAVYGASIAWANASAVAIPPGTLGVTANPELDIELRPALDSPILGAASTVYSLPFTDIYGYPNRSDLKICGAVQDVSNIS